MCQVRLREVGDLLDLEETILGNSLDQQSAVAWLLNGDVDAGREAGLQITVQLIQLAISRGNPILGVLGNVARGTPVSGLVAALKIQLVTQSLVVEFLLFAQVLKVRNGKGEANPIIGVSLG